MNRKQNFDFIIGKKFGKLTVVGWRRIGIGIKCSIQAKCRCECGRLIWRGYRCIKTRNTSACYPCTKIERKKWASKHGLSRSATYRAYRGMTNRCYREQELQYPDYGGRGITVCERWRGIDGVKNFAFDMGEKPTPKHSLDRIDVNGNYEPGNCRWATQSEQMNNIRVSNLLTATNVARATGYTNSHITQMLRKGILKGFLTDSFMGHKIYKPEVIDFLRARKRYAR